MRGQIAKLLSQNESLTRNLEDTTNVYEKQIKELSAKVFAAEATKKITVNNTRRSSVALVAVADASVAEAEENKRLVRIREEEILHLKDAVTKLLGVNNSQGEKIRMLESERNFPPVPPPAPVANVLNDIEKEMYLKEIAELKTQLSEKRTRPTRAPPKTPSNIGKVNDNMDGIMSPAMNGVTSNGNGMNGVMDTKSIRDLKSESTNESMAAPRTPRNTGTVSENVNGIMSHSMNGGTSNGKGANNALDIKALNTVFSPSGMNVRAGEINDPSSFDFTRFTEDLSQFEDRGKVMY